jgi:hypothetical protein
VVALWIAHTHAVEAFETTAFLAITSPEKQWGKTRLLDVLELVVARPWRAIMPSEAVVYRKIADVQPTLMLDETDAVFDESNPGSCNPCMCGKCEGRRVRHLRSNRFRGRYLRDTRVGAMSAREEARRHPGDRDAAEVKGSFRASGRPRLPVSDCQRPRQLRQGARHAATSDLG